MKKFALGSLLTLVIAGLALSCPVQSYNVQYQQQSCVARCAAPVVATAVVTPYIATVTVPLVAAQYVQQAPVVQQQVQVQQEYVPQPQAQFIMPQKQVIQQAQAVYAMPAVAAQVVIPQKQVYAQAAFVPQKQLVVQRNVYAAAVPQKVVVQQNVRRGLLGRLRDRIASRRGGGAVASQTVIVR